MYHFGIIYNESSILFTLGQNFLLVDLQEFYFRFRVGGGGGEVVGEKINLKMISQSELFFNFSRKKK